MSTTPARDGKTEERQHKTDWRQPRQATLINSSVRAFGAASRTQEHKQQHRNNEPTSITHERRKGGEWIESNADARTHGHDFAVDLVLVVEAAVDSIDLQYTARTGHREQVRRTIRHIMLLRSAHARHTTTNTLWTNCTDERQGTRGTTPNCAKQAPRLPDKAATKRSSNARTRQTLTNLQRRRAEEARVVLGVVLAGLVLVDLRMQMGESDGLGLVNLSER